jgi:hypothetical protein
MTRRLKVALATFVLCVLVGPSVTIFNLRVDASFDALRHTGDAVPAVVVSEHRRPIGRGLITVLEYKYKDIQYSGDVTCRRCYEVGEQLTIFVDPSDPHRFVTSGGTGTASMRTYLWVPGFALVCGTFISAGYAVQEFLRIRRDRQWYARRGLTGDSLPPVGAG